MSSPPGLSVVIPVYNEKSIVREACLELMARLDERGWDYGLALRRGILEARGRYVVADEIDLCDVRFHDRALAVLDAGGVDMVIGSKRAPGSHDHRPLYRRLATAVHNTLLRVALGFQGTDTHGVKAFLREEIAPTAARCVVDKDVFASELVLRA